MVSQAFTQTTCGSRRCRDNLQFVSLSMMAPSMHHLWVMASWKSSWLGTGHCWLYLNNQSHQSWGVSIQMFLWYGYIVGWRVFVWVWSRKYLFVNTARDGPCDSRYCNTVSTVFMSTSRSSGLVSCPSSSSRYLWPCENIYTYFFFFLNDLGRTP